MTRHAWYTRVALIWLTAIAVGIGLTLLVSRSGLHPTIQGFLDVALWSFIGILLSGGWSYRRYRDEQQGQYPE